MNSCTICFSYSLRSFGEPILVMVVPAMLLNISSCAVHSSSISANSVAPEGWDSLVLLPWGSVLVLPQANIVAVRTRHSSRQNSLFIILLLPRW